MPQGRFDLSDGSEGIVGVGKSTKSHSFISWFCFQSYVMVEGLYIGYKNSLENYDLFFDLGQNEENVLHYLAKDGNGKNLFVSSCINLKYL